MAEQVWRPRPCAYAHRRSGSPWVPVRSYYEGLPSMAGRGPDEGPAKAGLDQRGVTLPCPGPVDGPRVEDATVERRKAACPARHAAPQGADHEVALFGAPPLKGPMLPSPARDQRQEGLASAHPWRGNESACPEIRMER